MTSEEKPVEMAAKRVKTILGVMEVAKRMDIKQSEKFINRFIEMNGAASIAEVDTAYMYGNTKTEKYMGEMAFRNFPNVEIATKANPFQPGLSLTKECVRMQLETSLKNMQVDKVKIFYLHAPDHNTSVRETLEEVQKMYEEGKFERFGLSNFAAWEVAEVVAICKERGYIMPTVYQGMYNCLTRQVEKELIPCLRKFNMSFYAYNPLAGGILTGKHQFNEDTKNKVQGRFYGNNKWAEAYRKRFWNEIVFKSVDEIAASLKEHETKVSMAQASIRWMYHHSMLDSKYGDGVILGASRVSQLEENYASSQQGPLNEQVVKRMDECWVDTCYSCPNYFR